MITAEREQEPLRCIELLRKHPHGLTIEEIARLLPLNRNAASRHLNRMLVAGDVEMKRYGPAKVFFISKRVPLSQLLNLSNDLIMVLDNELFVRYVNHRMLDVFAIRQEDMVVHQLDHTPFGSFLTPQFRAKIREAEHGEECFIDEKIPINGHTWHFYIKCIPVVFDEGSQGVSVIFHDVSISKTLS